MKREAVSVPQRWASWGLDRGYLPVASVTLVCGTGEGVLTVTQEIG